MISSQHIPPRGGLLPVPLPAPLQLHQELITWFSPAIGPDNMRTVLVRRRGLKHASQAFHTRSTGRWIGFAEDRDITDEVEAWADVPTGQAREDEPAPAGAVGPEGC